MHIDSNCLINIVSANNRPAQVILSDSLNTNQYTYTYFHPNHFQFNINKSILHRNELTLKQGYFRFTITQKSSTQCLVFLLHTTNFAETTAVIHNSGFSTSENVIFCINLNLNFGAQQILYSFKNLVYMKHLQPFHAPLIFYMDKSKNIFVYCYFCPNRHTFHNYLMNVDHADLLKAYSILNGQGYGLHVRSQPPLVPGLPTFEEASICFKLCTGANCNLKTLNKALHLCRTPETLQYSPAQTLLNITVVLNILDFPQSEWNTAHWFVHLVVGETLLELPLEIVNERSVMHYAHFDQLWKAIVCVNVEDASVFDFTMLTAMAPPVWMALVATVILYAFVRQHLIKGLDIIWPLFGVSCNYKHPRGFLGILLLSMVWLSNTYQGGISSESMAFSEFPTFFDMINKGYKLEIGGWFSNFIPFWDLFLQPEVFDAIEPILNGKPLSHFLVGTVAKNDLQKDQFPIFLDKCTKSKSAISVVIDGTFGTGFYDVLGNKIWLVEEKFYCTGFNMAKYMKSEIKISVRAKGYLSGKFMRMLGKWLAMGLMIKFERLKSSLRRINITGALQIEPLGKLKDPGKIQLWSPIGILAFFGCVLALSLLSLELIQKLIASQKIIRIAIHTKCLRFWRWIKIYKRKNRYDK